MVSTMKMLKSRGNPFQSQLSIHFYAVELLALLVKQKQKQQQQSIRIIHNQKNDFLPQLFASNSYLVSYFIIIVSVCVLHLFYFTLKLCVTCDTKKGAQIYINIRRSKVKPVLVLQPAMTSYNVARGVLQYKLQYTTSNFSEP